MYRLYWQVHMHSCKTALWATHTREIFGHRLGLLLPRAAQVKNPQCFVKNGVTVKLKNTLLFSMPISFESGERLSFIVALKLSMIFIQQAVDSYVVPAEQEIHFPFIWVFSFSNY